MMVNVEYNMRTPNLKFILETILEDKPQPMSREEKRAFVQEVANFTALGESVYGKGDLEQMVERVKRIVENADRIMTESDDWMSNVAHKKNNKRMHEDYRDFEQAARELKESQDRMAMCYENIGQHLSRYFDVN
jgi:uncharacterized protein (UPF0335 family)